MEDDVLFYSLTDQTWLQWMQKMQRWLHQQWLTMPPE
jgi:hypothetical protein